MSGLLIFIGLILVILNVLSIKKQNKSFDGVLGHAIEDIGDYDIKLGEVRREFSESILQLQSEIVAMGQTIERISNERDHIHKIYVEDEIHDEHKLYVKNKINNEEKFYNEEKDESVVENKDNINTSKVEDIKRLFSEGMSVSQISEILKLGKGEVLLIKDLYIK